MIISPAIWSPISPPNGLTLLYLQVIDKQIHFLTNLQNQIEVSPPPPIRPPPLLFLGVVHRQDPARRTWCTVEIRRGERGAPSRSGGESVVHHWRGSMLSPAKVVKSATYEYFIS